MSNKQLYQNDSRWKDNKIGTQNALTIEQVGCLLTSMAMIVNHFGANETPASLNERMKANNGFTGAWIKSAQVPGQFPQLGMQRQKRVQCEGTPAPMSLIDSGLQQGSLIAVRVDWTPDANIDSHWVVLYQKQGDDYLMWDPWQKDDAPNTLLGRYGFGGKKAEDVILEAIWHGKGELQETADPVEHATAIFKRPKDITPTPAPAPTPTETGDPIAVKPTIELKLRQQPISGTQLKVLATTETLQVLDTTSTARAKLGKQGQWLRVQDASGTEGYVAAWLVQETAVIPTTPPSPTPAPVTPPAVTTFKVKVTTQQLSFRSEPRVANDTLIRYLTTNTTLDVIDEDGKNKLGKDGQWLKVRTSDGKEGYVAAWFVAEF
ncbi:MAG: SH3 domain-containing protein [Chloroflexota bacterium]